MAIVTQTDRPKSVRNRCEIEVFGGVFVLTRRSLDFCVGVGAFVIGLSQISSFFSYFICGRGRVADVRHRMICLFCLIVNSMWL